MKHPAGRMATNELMPERQSLLLMTSGIGIISEFEHLNISSSRSS